MTFYKVGFYRNFYRSGDLRSDDHRENVTASQRHSTKMFSTAGVFFHFSRLGEVETRRKSARPKKSEFGLFFFSAAENRIFLVRSQAEASNLLAS